MRKFEVIVAVILIFGTGMSQLNVTNSGIQPDFANERNAAAIPSHNTPNQTVISDARHQVSLGLTSNSKRMWTSSQFLKIGNQTVNGSHNNPHIIEQKIQPPSTQPTEIKPEIYTLKPVPEENFMLLQNPDAGTPTEIERLKSPRANLSNGGILLGTMMQSITGKMIEAFRGIPYAKPPVGQLRFKPPQEAPVWFGERLATKDAPSCPQMRPFVSNSTIIGNENCLYLNVYTPQNRVQNESLPVMVYFHGGGFSFGSSNSELYGPQRLLDYDVVLVTSNYRLGPIGFLSTGSLDCPGNNGLKDQLEVLKWVNKNIKHFGGDPHKVTIFGQSAGAASVAYHLVSVQTEGLFQKAIMQSGTNLNSWAFVRNRTAIYRAKKLKDLLNCNSTDDNWPKALDCMRNKTAEEIISVVTNFYSLGNDPIVAFGPVIEPEHETAYLTDNPQNILASHGTKMPVMIGVNAEEGVLKSGPILNHYANELKEKFRKVLPKFLYYDDMPREVRRNITSWIDKFYFNRAHNWTKENHHNLTNLFSDRLYFSGMDQYLRNRFAERNTSVGTTYVYLFDHKGSSSLSTLYGGNSEFYGVTHGDELPYLFPMNSNLGVSEHNDMRIKWAIPRMWTYFATTGNPTPVGAHIRRWKSTRKLKLRYAHIGSKNISDMTILRNSVGLLETRMRFWRRIEHNFLSS